ncbi:MAG: circadian clock KaiB family protein [Magnetococcus sp. YQC-3]
MKNNKNKDTTKMFEMAVANRETEKYTLCLYVSGMTPRATRAIANIKQICEEHLEGRYTLEVIDLFQQPERAEIDQIVAVPTLIKRLPPPLRRIIGEMSNPEYVLVGLDLRKAP